MYMQRATSGAAGSGLYTTIKYMRGAAGIDLGTTAKYLTHNERRREQRTEHHDQAPCKLNAGACRPVTERTGCVAVLKIKLW
jgi:shikimate kinase